MGQVDELEYLNAYIREAAHEYIEGLPRDKRVIASRYVFKFREHPRSISDMGFCQYLQRKILEDDSEG